MAEQISAATEEMSASTQEVASTTADLTDRATKQAGVVRLAADDARKILGHRRGAGRRGHAGGPAERRACGGWPGRTGRSSTGAPPSSPS